MARHNHDAYTQRTLTSRLPYCSNNVLSSSVSSLDLHGADSATLLGNPQSYLSSVSEIEAKRIRDTLIPAYRIGFQIIFILGASLCAFAFVVAFFMMPQVDLSRTDDAKLKEEGRKAAAPKEQSDGSR